MCDKVKSMNSYGFDSLDVLRFSVSSNNCDNYTVIIDENLKQTSCECPAFYELHNSSGSRQKAVQCILNCKHIVFAMIQIGVKDDNPILARHNLSDDVIVYFWMIGESGKKNLEQG